MKKIILFLISFSLFSSPSGSNWIQEQWSNTQNRANNININGTNFIPQQGIGQQFNFNSLGPNLLSNYGNGGDIFNNFGGQNNIMNILQQIQVILNIAGNILNQLQVMFGGRQFAPNSNNTDFPTNSNVPEHTNSGVRCSGGYFGTNKTISGDLRYDTDGPGGASSSSTHQSSTSSRYDGGMFPHMSEHGAVSVKGSGAEIGDLVVVERGGQSRVVPITDHTAQTNTVNGKDYGTDIVEVSKHTYDDMGGSDARTSMTNTGVNVANGTNLSSSTMNRVDEVNNRLKSSGGQATKDDLNYIQTGQHNGDMTPVQGNQGPNPDCQNVV